jgi:hypothetical protein
MAILGTSLQILAAIAVVLILFMLAYYIFNREALNSLKQNIKLKNRIDIFSGVKDMAISNNESYSTTIDNGGLYMDLRPSVNQSGGIEFSYNFWLYQDADFQTDSNTTYTTTTPDTGLNTGDVILLLRGKNKVIDYKNFCNQNKYDVYVKCPLIKMENKGDSLTVEFNTQQSPDIAHEGAKNRCTTANSEWQDANSYKVSVRGFKSNPNFENRWFMVSVVVQDTYPDDSLPMRNKTRARIYINGVLELDQYVDTGLDQVDGEPSVLKPNNGDLYVFPQLNWKDNNNNSKNTTVASNSQVKKLAMADLSYFNYVLNAREIVSMYQAGFNKSYAKPPIGSGYNATQWLTSMSNTRGKRELQSN